MKEFFTTPKTVTTLQCNHCGNQTITTILFKYERVEEKHPEESTEQPFNYAGDMTIEQTITSWFVIRCSKCLKPTLIESHEVGERAYNEREPRIKSQRSNVLYPTEKVPLSNLPTVIEKAYLAALKVRYEPNACAVLVGRTLEVACNHEKAQGRTLAEKLSSLASSNRIPKTLADMAQQLRELRNFGAHAAEDEVTEEDVPIILDFLEAILEYLYVAPAKIEAVRKRFNKHSEVNGDAE